MHGAISQAALRAERGICLGRAIFFTGILLRFLVGSDLTVGRVLITVPPLVVTIAFSLWVLLRVKAPPRGLGLYLTSTLLDCCTVLQTLLPNVLWPTHDQRGILFLPDTTGVLLATIAAGLRLSPWVALAGGLANTFSLAALVLVDRAVSGSRYEVCLQTASIYLLFVAAAALLAAVLAQITRRLARHSAIAAMRAERAELGLGAVLGDSHDLGALLTSATIGAELIVEQLADHAAADSARELHANLRQIRAVAVDVRDRAMGDLTALSERVSVSLVPALRHAVAQVDARYHVPCQLQEADEGLRVLVAGGQPTLQRILLNLLLNACEGDDRGGASQVWLRTKLDERVACVRIEIEDDGPGFAEAALQGRVGSGKAGGTGVGLGVARGLIEASGGLLRLGNREGGGARVVVTLERAPV